MAAAANRVVALNGGIVVVNQGESVAELALPIAGIISDQPLLEVNRLLEEAKHTAYSLGVSRGIDPFMTLSFMALPVIPELRITTRGVFDVSRQTYV
jgi:adenine deaminase